MNQKFECEIDCAICAAKVEEAANKIDGVKSVSINFMTQKMTLEADDDRFDEILEEVVRTGRKVEPDFSVER